MESKIKKMYFRFQFIQFFKGILLTIIYVYDKYIFGHDELSIGIR